MLIDEVEIIVVGGHGGAGLISFGKRRRSGPDGGNGGKGGDVYFEVKDDITLLNQFSQKKYLKAQDGEPGGRNKRTGKDGEDLVIFIPKGSTLLDKDTDKEKDFDVEGEKLLIAKGGKGGGGNWEFRSSTNTTPMYAQPGLVGGKKKLLIHLKLIADFGLIGLPNAGKTSLLNTITKAHGKVAEYPFTTLEPNLGVLNGKIIADIPGLIEGASKGKGLGIKFLKHIEKVKVLLHCISCESKDFLHDYHVVRTELEKYNPKLIEKEEIILLTKSDLKIKRVKMGKEVIPVSIYNPEQIKNLEKLLTSLL